MNNKHPGRRSEGASVVRSFLASTSWWIAVSSAWVVLSTIWSGATGDWGWFGRSGSILTVAGLVLAGRAIMREGRAGFGGSSPFVIAKVVGSSVDRGGGVRMRLEHSRGTKVRWYEEGRDATAAVLGLALAAVGTIIWGYGDLLARLFAK